MYWKYNSLNTSELESLLDKDPKEIDLKIILEQEEVLQEAKNQNKKLVDYLTGIEVLSDLINLIICEPPCDLPENVRFKHPHIAAELLTCEIPQINDILSADETLLNQLYSFMEQDPPLNPLLSSFFSKAFGVLLSRKKEQNWYSYQVTCLQVIEFLKKKEFIQHLLKHIGTSAISDLVLKLITCVEGSEMKQNMLQWLNEKKLIQSIIGLMDPVNDRDTHDNASRLLIEILRASRDNQCVPLDERCDDPILSTLESPDIVSLVMDQMLGATKSESTIVNGISILLALIETRKPQQQQSIYTANYNPEPEPGLTPEDIERQEKVLDATIDAIVPKLSDFTALLLDPPVKNSLKTTGGLLDPPLGATRLSIAKLVSALLATNHLSVNIELTTHNTIDILLDLFFKYSLNNFLHQYVEQCISHVFNWKTNNDDKDDDLDLFGEKQDEKNNDENSAEKSSNNGDEENSSSSLKQDEKTATWENPLLVHLFSNCRLVERVLDAWEENESEESQPGFHRKGYMGHLTKIANVMHQHADKTGCKDLIGDQMKKLPDSTNSNWVKFVNGKLAAINERNTIVPASAYPNRVSSSEDEDTDFRDIQFPPTDSLQQMFSDYQMQQMSDHFIDSFGFNNDEFADTDENGGSMRKFSNFSQEESSKGQEMFESVCDRRFGGFPNGDDDEDDDDEDWNNKTKEINFSDKKESSSAIAALEDVEDDSDDEDIIKDVVKMDVDNPDPWGSNSVTAMDTGNPWENKTDDAKPQLDSWASFDEPSSKKEESMEETSNEDMKTETNPKEEPITNGPTEEGDNSSSSDNNKSVVESVMSESNGPC